MSEGELDGLDGAMDQALAQADATAVLDAVWAILACSDRQAMSLARPKLPAWRKAIRKIPLGGAFHPNENYFNLALEHIQTLSDGGCRCAMYRATSMFSPQVHERKGHVLIHQIEVDTEAYETHFSVSCVPCGKRFRVTEVSGWHVPWFQWHPEPEPAGEE